MQTDKIILANCQFSVRIGVTEEERHVPQDIFLDMTLYTDIRDAAQSDSIDDAVCYDEMHRDIAARVEQKEYCLIETLVEEIAALALKHTRVLQVTVQARKPAALKQRNVAYAAIEITRTRSA